MLNAFRHHRGGHKVCESDNHEYSGKSCSTPFGITEVGTPGLMLCFGAISEPCSTPFGITEVGTRGDRTLPGEIGSCELVLNAFRHHRGQLGTMSQVSACSVNPDRACAQRLSASQRWAHSVSANDGFLSCASGCCCAPNAFSAHHRGGHAFIPDLSSGTYAPFSMCSTPFGITEVGTTSPLAYSINPFVVLNAFRHHRGGHFVPDRPGRAYSGQRSVCSTPFGIKQRWARLASHRKAPGQTGR